VGVALPRFSGLSERLATGWGVVAAAFLTFAVSAGMMHSYPVFFVAFLAEFGWGRAQASLAYSASLLLSGASSPLVGTLVDRVGPRRLVLLGGVALALGLALSAGVSSLWHLVALYGVVMTVGANCLGLVVLTPLVARYFVAKRGLVLAIVQSANGFGRAGAVPTVQFLISTIGWRHAYLALAAAMALVIVPLARSFRRGTASAIPEGAARAPRSDGRRTHDWTLGEAMATPHFWLLFLVYLLTGLGSFFVSLHQLAFLADVGFDPLHAASPSHKAAK